MKRDETEKLLIQDAIQQFTKTDFEQATQNLWKSLGYSSDLIVDISDYSFAQMKETFVPVKEISGNKILVDHWIEHPYLMQLTENEMGEQGSWETLDQFKKGFLRSYILMPVSLSGYDYTRKQLVDATREINKFFKQPVWVMFLYNHKLTLSIIDRRVNRKDSDKDVLEKVTLIKDISIDNPHRAHIEILHEISLRSLRFISFDEFHQELKKKLSISELNKKFYKVIADWYFRAKHECVFPEQQDCKKSQETSLIRFLSRILFVWFMKEKGLVPAELFTKEYFESALHTSNPDDSSYYRAVLQNLFFATLNCPIEKRGWVKEHQGKSHQYTVTTQYRFQKLHKHPQQFIENYMAKIPFINGGLFECLDQGEGNDRVMVDCFSDIQKNHDQLSFPNHLFFEKQDVDLSKENNSKKPKIEKIDGLFDILNKYKFTVEENTPIDQEIALDPELLGHVLENLLAEFNPETQKSARKETGSYYTPREIVNYMVDESLIAYIANYMKQHDGSLANMHDLDELLRETFAYTVKEHPFDPKQVDIIIKAIRNLKVLDPACGSGAFPMGVLLKMVYVLERIDSDNTRWKKHVLDELPEEMRSYVEVNTNSYNRKLGLIWNCIYGVDIQPIAVQLAKLRFFISLLVDQVIKPDDENFGIIPLPNLETKFVAANTLISVKRELKGDDEGHAQSDWLDDHLDDVKHAIKNNRMEYFSANTRNKKKKLKETDITLREQLKEQLLATRLKGKGAEELASRIASWDPYNVHEAADWFDPEFMFMFEQNELFDIVIGNPPYIQLQKHDLIPTDVRDQYQAESYDSFEKTGDIYCLFYEKAVKLLNEKGVLCYITSNKWMRAKYGEKLRGFLSENHPHVLIDLGAGVFESATVDTNILLVNKGRPEDEPTRALTAGKETDLAALKHDDFVELANLSCDNWLILDPIEQRIKAKIEKYGTPLKDWDIRINRGILTGYNEAFIIDGEKKDELIAQDPKSAEIIRPILRGRDIKKYRAEFADKWLIATHNGYKDSKDNDVPAVDVNDFAAVKAHLDLHWMRLAKRQDKGDTPYNLRSCAYMEDFSKPKIVYPNMTKYIPFYYDKSGYMTNQKCFILTGEHIEYLTVFLNSSLFKFCFLDLFPDLQGERRELGKVYFETLMLTDVPNSVNEEFAMMLEEIQSLETSCPQSIELEKRIDRKLFDMYGLSETEQKAIGYIVIT